MIVSLSSTAIVLKYLQDNNETQTMVGKLSIIILVFQDLVAIIFVIFIPFLENFNLHLNFFELLYSINFLEIILKIITFLLIFYLLYKFLIPFILYQIVKIRNKDLFVLSIISICFLIALGTYKIGLSLAFGAFLAGLLISETQYSYESLSSIIPFKIIFTSIFFSSIGMIANIEFFLRNFNWVYVIFLTLLFFIIKFIIVFIMVLILYKNFRIGFITGLYLCQIGEFSLVILKISYHYHLLDNNLYQSVLISSILTMLLTPICMKYSYIISNYFYNILYRWNLKIKNNYLAQIIKKSETIPIPNIENLKDHIVIIGYGINGKNVAKAAKIVDIPYIIIEMNIKTVLLELKKGESIVFGDATNIQILEHVRIDKAKLLVIVINDFKSTERIIKLSKKLNPNIYIITRTRYIAEVQPLYNKGANDVIPEEFETSIQIFRKILEHYNFSFPEIQFFMEELRTTGYEILRNTNS